MNYSRYSVCAAALLLAIVGIAGCTDNQKTDTPAEQTGVQAKEGARDTANAADRKTDNLGNKAEGALAELSKDTKEATATLKVKNALMTTDKKLNWKTVDVDTARMTVFLRGSVPTADQKKLAEQIARKTAGSEFTVKNQLQVVGK